MCVKKIIISSHSVILIHKLVKMEYFNLIWVNNVIMEDNQVVKIVKYYLDGIALVDKIKELFVKDLILGVEMDFISHNLDSNVMILIWYQEMVAQTNAKFKMVIIVFPL